MNRMFVFLLTMVTLVGCARIDETEHCVMVRYGNVIQERMKEGLAWLPIADAECFPLIDQNYPDTIRDREIVSAQTSDPVTITGDLALVWAYDPATVFQVFKEKRSHRAVEVEVINAIREGYRTALAGWSVQQIFSANRAALSDSVRVHIQRKLGTRGIIKTVYVRDITLPESIEAARTAAAQQEQILDKALKQYAIDSVEARATLIKADAQAETMRLQAAIYRGNPDMLRIEIEKAKAQAFANICGKATTCIIGGSVMDTWTSGVPR